MSPALRRFQREYPEELRQGTASVFIGAGVSMSAGYPSWTDLLRDIGEDLGVRSADVHDLAALAQWSIQEHGGATRVRNVIRAEIGVDKDVPDAVATLARLPLRQLWTTNYDRLIERAFEGIRRPLDVVSGAKDLAIKGRPGAARLYKMHGSVDRLDDLVISTDDYELYRSSRGAFLPLLQAHLTSTSMLFLGLSFTDPNVRHVLSLIRESFTDAPPEHFAIVRPPQPEDFSNPDTFEARLAQHNHWARDLLRYGLTAIEIASFAEVPSLLREVERRVAKGRVWVSGSLPTSASSFDPTSIYALSEAVGAVIGDRGYALVSGAGQVVGSATLAGFLRALRYGGGWDLERRLIARPFPQPMPGAEPDREQWTALRSEMARLAGIVIFIGGLKDEGGTLVEADGVLEEAALATDAGAFLLPVGATGGAAKAIAQRLLGSDVPVHGADASRPTDDELMHLMDAGASLESTLQVVRGILDRLS